MFITTIMLILTIFCIFSTQAAPLQVETLDGPVLGSRRQYQDTRTGQLVTWTQYRGVPYAAPPLGELRFRPPQPADWWTQPRHVSAQQPDPICPQIILGELSPQSDEDCLYLNIHVPDDPVSDDILPVMVWIHGGAYRGGSGTPQSFGPEYFMGHGVVVVTINYRLGPLGFLSLGSEDIGGNMGQLDQVAALHWVQDNIQEFGGNPDAVTIFGQSAGAYASTYHLFSPLTRGLFKRIIAQSGVGGFAPSFHHHQEADAARLEMWIRYH